MRSLLLFLIVNLALVPPLHSDTIFLKNGDLSMNGMVTYKDGEFQVKGMWQAKAAAVAIPAGLVKGVRFNTLNDNASPPPEFPIPRGKPPIRCEVVFQKNPKPKSGVLELIDESSVRVSGVGVGRQRVSVLRIVSQ